MHDRKFGNTDWHSRIVRCDEYPLEVGDSMEIHSCQVNGFCVDGSYIGFLVPGIYVVVNADENSVHVKRGGREPYHVSAYLLRAVLGDSSRYKKSTQQDYTDGAFIH